MTTEEFLYWAPLFCRGITSDPQFKGTKDEQLERDTVNEARRMLEERGGDTEGCGTPEPPPQRPEPFLGV